MGKTVLRGLDLENRRLVHSHRDRQLPDLPIALGAGSVAARLHLDHRRGRDAHGLVVRLRRSVEDGIGGHRGTGDGVHVDGPRLDHGRLHARNGTAAAVRGLFGTADLDVRHTTGGRIDRQRHRHRATKSLRLGGHRNHALRRGLSSHLGSMNGLGHGGEGCDTGPQSRPFEQTATRYVCDTHGISPSACFARTPTHRATDRARNPDGMPATLPRKG